jgi:hypothetical protein
LLQRSNAAAASLSWFKEYFSRYIPPLESPWA